MSKQVASINITIYDMTIYFLLCQVFKHEYE